MVDPNDAKGITVPLIMLASQDEDKEAVKGFEANLNVPKHVETFDDQVHGWLAARYVPDFPNNVECVQNCTDSYNRGDLENERVKKEYERGYATLLDFFHKHL